MNRFLLALAFLIVSVVIVSGHHKNLLGHVPQEVNHTLPIWMEPIRYQFKQENYERLSRKMDTCVRKLKKIHLGMYPVIQGCNIIHSKDLKAKIDCKLGMFRKYGKTFPTYPDVFVKCMH
ncbi:hypothetical protein WR25_15184 [Diploscapter pachys]|uniref:Uncharacterized protein n=1 Tax=Diploscapter pachys TaxID=2018661 RepID=A0A2A2KX75_9BILA|nr:hypothetical protein WR25_15184 [Diploscapter pachys]